MSREDDFQWVAPERRRVRIADIKADPRYRQKQSDIAVRALTESVRKNGWEPQRDFPILVNEREDGLYVIDGWTRLTVLANLGVEEIDADVYRLTLEEEIKQFIGRNTRRVRLR